MINTWPDQNLSITSIMSNDKYFGKFRGVVQNNLDPEGRGRLQVSIPDVLDPNQSPWAEACVPFLGSSGASSGFYALPPIGTNVWIEFEQGNPDYPIWVGCQWQSSFNSPPS